MGNRDKGKKEAKKPPKDKAAKSISDKLPPTAPVTATIPKGREKKK